MIIEYHTTTGTVDKAYVSMQDAETAYQARREAVLTPDYCYYRIVIKDGDRIARDTEHEWYGRQTMTPGMIVYHGKCDTLGLSDYLNSDGCVPFGTKGE